MAMTSVALLTVTLAALPAVVFLINLHYFRRPPTPAAPDTLLPKISVLVPARNEESSIADCLSSLLASSGVELELFVLDDRSTDRTAAVVEQMARQDARLRLIRAPELPPGWCGKQHACFCLARAARQEVLIFVDADVRLARDGLSRLVRFLDESGSPLVSGFPRQITGTLVEHLVLPLIHFVLLGFLPVWRMRASSHPSYGAGCGQLIATVRTAYEASGGHAAIRNSLHDGIKLPRAYRAAGFRTDLCDATDIASCRMYSGVAEVWKGLAKNAGEGLGSPQMIAVSTFLLFFGQVFPPFALLASLVLQLPSQVSALFGIAVILAYLPRCLAALRFRQSWLGAMLHPLGVCVLLAVQWYALACWLIGHPATWKGRSYQPSLER